MKLFEKRDKATVSVSLLDKDYKKGKITFEEWERGYLVHLFFLMYNFKLEREHCVEKLREQLDKFNSNGEKTDLQLALEVWKNQNSTEEAKLNALIDIDTYRILGEMNGGKYYTLTMMNDWRVMLAAALVKHLQEEYRNKCGFTEESTLYGRPFLSWLNDETLQRDGMYRYYKAHNKDTVAREKAETADLLTTKEAHDLICVYVKLVLESAERYAKEHNADIDTVLYGDDFGKLDCFTEDMLFVKPDGTLAETDIHLFDRFDAKFDLSAVPTLSEYKKMRNQAK